MTSTQPRGEVTDGTRARSIPEVKVDFWEDTT